MVILDKVSNGYRDFILPMALHDEVLCRAVGVVAAQHLSQGRPALEMTAEKGRAAVISRFRRDASLADQVFNEFTWATLIVLLVGETVTGNADYGLLVQMLLCLSNNNVIKTMESRPAACLCHTWSTGKSYGRSGRLWSSTWRSRVCP